MKRRAFLRAAGVAIALPSFEAWGRPSAPKPRLVCLCAPLGLHPKYFWPAKEGKDYAPTPYLEVLKDFRGEMTVVQGMSHPGMSPGFAHQADASFLTGAPGAGRPGFRNSISLDQRAAEVVGDRTRFRSLVLTGGGTGISWTRTGAMVPAEARPSAVFARMFLADSPEEIATRERRLAEGRSALDDVRSQAERLKASLSTADREKLEEYLTSVRELEKRLAKDETWFRKPKPAVDAKPPKDVTNAADLLGRTRQLLDLAALAIQTDSTRLVTIMLGGSTNVPPIDGVTLGHHDLSHHGKDPGKLAQLKVVEIETLKVLRDFLARLKAVREDAGSLLDQTSVYLGSNLGDGSSHSIKNLPALVVGGGFKHAGHKVVDPSTPLCNLYLALLRRLGIEDRAFGTSTRALEL